MAPSFFASRCLYVRFVALLFVCAGISLILWGQKRGDIQRFISGMPESASEVVSYFTAFAEREGVERASIMLTTAAGELPAGVDAHEIGHVLGDMLYAEEGIRGFTHCTHDFYNACAHSIVIRHLVAHGTEQLSDFLALCTDTAHGLDDYRLCLHGVGHGVLAAERYSVPRALERCFTLGEGRGIASSTEAIACAGGVVMELTEGGVHARADWARARDVYLRTDEPFYLCERVVPTEARLECYFYLTEFLIARVSNDTERERAPIDQKVLAAAFDSCVELVRESAERRYCIGGIARHIVPDTLAKRVSGGGDESLRLVYGQCAMAVESGDIASCVFAVARRFSWGGSESAVRVAVWFCDVATTHRDFCYRGIIDSMVGALRWPEDGARVCKTLPLHYRASCVATVLKTLRDIERGFK